jgi:hypothetical protein
MRESDRFRSALERALDSREPLKAAKLAFEREFPKLPEGLVDAAFADLRSMERQADWLIALGGVLYRDYDGTPISLEGWEAIRDLVNDFAGELDMDVVSYAMSLAMERGAFWGAEGSGDESAVEPEDED